MKKSKSLCSYRGGCHWKTWLGKIITSRKRKIHPTPEQQKIFRQWITASRYTYNQTVQKVEKEKQKVNFYQLQKWLLGTPKDIRVNSVRESVMFWFLTYQFVAQEKTIVTYYCLGRMENLLNGWHIICIKMVKGSILLQKCTQVKPVEIVDNIDNHLSNKDTYSCECCKLKISRDVNGARNILLKHLK